MSSTTRTAQYLTFRLGGELFAVDVANVREVLELTRITRVPTAPEYMRGVVNVRGKAIAVVDLRVKFGLPEAEPTVNTRIIVIELNRNSELTVVGGMADSVHEVIELEPSQIAPPPKIAMRGCSELIRGMARRGEDFLMLLDVNSAFSTDELTAIDETSAEDEPALAS